MAPLGKLLILFGVLIVLMGFLMVLGGRIPWVGRLPGDIVIRRERFTFYFPITTSLLISIILTFVLWLLRK